ncbi:unnamed protein product [Blepharisma stoltei]|uniref:Sphingomyelin phosphodiesterase n=1 Tax=Blepharisma stoltei TaxID=1481888 RepID=A0AAU9JJC8_9CILI|nr:unnamed protein product [Blepharisma stoltei]
MPAINPWPETGNNTFFVLQITDIHLDFLYQPGSQSSNCNSPLCCRNGEGDAGYWGTRAVCDLPPHTLLAFLQDFKQYNISFVVWTGDNSPHDQWNYDIDQVLNYTKTITKWFKEYIDVPVFPVIGNHDCFPMDFFNPGHEQVLIGNLSEWWEGWLSPEEIQQFSINGFYSALEPNTGFRVIGINNILGDNLNIFLVPNNTDPSQMLEWLRNELYQAEKNNEPVIIIGHIPNGDKFLDSDWARHYRVIVNRFQNIIRGQFFGHTHYDEFTVVNSIIPNTKNPGVIHTAPAFTTHSYINPSFRLYEYDWETKHLVNIHQYRLPLYQVNQGPSEAVFEKAYDYKGLYKMNDMSPSSFELIAEQVLNDAGFAQKFYENWLSQYPDEAGQCDEKCQKSLYCRLTSDVFNEAVTCDVDNKSSYLLYRVLEAWQGPWEYISE